jgi:hypothetical protein
MKRHRHVRRAAGQVCLVLLLLLTVLTLAAPASAAPPGETLSLAELRVLLESGPLNGHMKTTLSGYTVSEVPVTVHALVEDSWGSFILFEASGPAIERIGGIALGMSGSPVYVDDGGVTKLTGAVSYGSSFTLGGMGLATPIEYMADLQATYVPELVGSTPAAATAQPASPAGTYELDEAVKTEAGTLSKVTIAASAAAAETLGVSAETAVMTPLAVLEIGGLLPQSDAYKDLAALLGTTGLVVRPASGTGTWEGPPAPPLQPGSPCCAMYSTGTVWYGAAGTTTYVDGDTVLMFGHPLWWVGATEAALHAGYVSAIWPSLYFPQSLIAPRDEKGTVVQDRYWGVIARLGQEPDMVPVTTHAVYPDAGIDVTDHSSVSQWMLSTPEYSSAGAMVTMYALTAANDTWSYVGSAETLTTIAVSDDTGSYVVERDNLWDSEWDVASEASWDVYALLGALSEDDDGVLQPHIDSITLDATISPLRRTARIAAVVLPKGLLAGDNPVVIRYYRYGSSELQELQGTLTLPTGVSRTGVLVVTPGAWSGWYDDCCDDWDYWYDVDSSPPQTLAELVEELNDHSPNSDLLVQFRPDYSTVEEYEPIQTRLNTDYVFSNDYYGRTARVSVSADRTVVPFGGGVTLKGYVYAGEGAIKVEILRRDAGRTEEILVKTFTLSSDGYRVPFTTKVGDLRRNTRLVVRAHPSNDMLTANGVVGVKVRAAVSLNAEVLATSARLTVKVKPAVATGTVLLEKYVDGRWVVLRSAPRAADQVVTFRVYRGTHVLRARFINGDICANGTSPTLTVKVK